MPKKEAVPNIKRIYITPDKAEWIDLQSSIYEKISYLLKKQPNEEDKHNDIVNYFNSADAIQGANCHKTALFLTGKIDDKQLFHPDNTDIKKAGHYFVSSLENTTLHPEINSFEELAEKLKNINYPIRITFFKVSKNQKYMPIHSVTILGITNKGKLLGFHKEDAYADNPFEFINIAELSTVYLTHNHIIGIESTGQ